MKTTPISSNNIWHYGTEEWQDANGEPFDYATFSSTNQPANSQTYNEPWQQDGVAPQCPVPGLSFLQTVNTSSTEFQAGRIKFDGEPEHLNFLEAHYGENYDWIFTRFAQGQDGFVRERE